MAHGRFAVSSNQPALVLQREIRDISPFETPVAGAILEPGPTEAATGSNCWAYPGTCRHGCGSNGPSPDTFGMKAPFRASPKPLVNDQSS
jgi:hypothetical protein